MRESLLEAEEEALYEYKVTQWDDKYDKYDEL